MEDVPTVAAYRALEKELLAVRELHNGASSPEEDAILDNMDKAWDNLTWDGIEWLNANKGPYYDALTKWFRWTEEK